MFKIFNKKNEKPMFGPFDQVIHAKHGTGIVNNHFPGGVYLVAFEDKVRRVKEAELKDFNTEYQRPPSKKVPGPNHN